MFVTTASACVNVWVLFCVGMCVLYHLQVNLQITGRVCLSFMCVHVMFSAGCAHVVHVFSPGNRQVPLQSQTAGCSLQSLTP